jgi:hypothetical protein
MNDFASTENTATLKDYYVDSDKGASASLTEALRRRRKRLAEINLTSDDEDEKQKDSENG